MELRKKVFTYRGKDLEELKTLDIREFAKYLTSRQRRTVLRQFHEIQQFINRAKKKDAKGKKIKTHRRDLIMVPELVGLKIQIYNGMTFVPVEIIPEMLGHKFGEFAPSRGRVKHGSSGVGATEGSRAKSKK